VGAGAGTGADLGGVSWKMGVGGYKTGGGARKLGQRAKNKYKKKDIPVHEKERIKKISGTEVN